MTQPTLDKSKGTWFKAEDWDNLTGGLPLYRGVFLPLEQGKVQIPAPINRTPKNLPMHVHTFVDQWFVQHLGAPFRSQALYGTGNFEKAQAHAGAEGEVVLIRPNQDFTFCWSPNSYDLAGDYAQLESDDHLEQMLLEAQFNTTDLEQALLSGHEIMIISDSFTAERVLTI